MYHEESQTSSRQFDSSAMILTSNGLPDYREIHHHHHHHYHNGCFTGLEQ